ncbi:MAG: hypothetical protein U5J99_14850 [Parvularculaceae bacterium]|nr:hypothetical protein [Parvularculaceae bacterium]
MSDRAALKIASGDYVCVLAPSLGGAILSLSDGKGPLLRSGTAQATSADPRRSACFPCVPWFGRLSAPVDGVSLKATLPDASPLPLHGDGWISAFDVETHTEDRLQCRYSPQPSPSGFPHPYEAQQDFRLTAQGLTITLSVRNTGARAMPAGLGLHPYFRRTPASRISFSADALWTPPASSPGALGALPGGLGSAAFTTLPDNTIDHSFTGFGGTLLVETAEGVIRLTSAASILHLYAPADEDYFCAEPVSHLPGDFGRARLAPGASSALTVSIARAA